MTKLTDTKYVGEYYSQDRDTIVYVYATLAMDEVTLVGLHEQWQPDEGCEWRHKILLGEPELWQSN